MSLIWILLAGGLILLALIAFLPWRRRNVSIEASEQIQQRRMEMDAPLSSSERHSLQQEIENLLAYGQKLQAIKLYRQRTGCGLREAKDAVENIGSGYRSFQAATDLYPSATNQSTDDDFNAEIRRLLETRQKIQAIKLYRQRTGCALQEAKAAVERIERG